VLILRVRVVFCVAFALALVEGPKYIFEKVQFLSIYDTKGLMVHMWGSN